MIQRRLAWPLSKEDMQMREAFHIFGNDNPICRTEKETEMYRTDFWTLWGKARVGRSERTASKHVYYQV